MSAVPEASARGVRRSLLARATALAVAGGVVAGTSVLALGGAAGATPVRHNATVNHAYRHGLVPMFRKGATYPNSTKNLKFQGGVSGVGVTTGSPKVYLVFWGSQWGTQGTNSKGFVTFTGDPVGAAPYIDAFFSGLGTGSEKWSGVMTQYCQGVATGTQICGTGGTHIPYPSSAVVAGIWEDNSAAAPAASTGHGLAVEAEKAATHFGNTTTASNRSTQYDIISPHGTDPDSYEVSGFCAWHDYSGDSTLDGGGGASGPLIAFTNMPYVSDVGASCGAGFVNSGNNLDGYSIVNGHEYAETITDQYPAGGWIDAAGEETGDLCAWKTSGPGRSQDLTLTTGKFAVQGTWSNLSNTQRGACEVGLATQT